MSERSEKLHAQSDRLREDCAFLRGRHEALLQSHNERRESQKHLIEDMTNSQGAMMEEWNRLQEERRLIQR